MDPVADAPWWLVILLGGALTIASTIVGAVIASVTARTSDRSQERRERDRREHEVGREEKIALRAAAAKFLVESRQYVADYRRQVRFSQETKRYEFIASPVPTDIRAAYEAYWNLVLIGKSDINRAARRLLEVTREFRLDKIPSSGKPPLATSRLDDLHARHAKARGVLANLIIPTDAKRIDADLLSLDSASDAGH